jgi:Fic family protein
MAFTEVKRKNNKRYYYRVKSVREGKKVKRESVYLGVDLSKKELRNAEKEADRELTPLSYLLKETELRFLNKLKKDFVKEPKETYDNRYEAFTSLFTYDSTAIEGNTMSLQETSFLLFDKRVPSNKSLREINESLNHKQAFDYLLSYKGDITKELISSLHGLVVKETLKPELKKQIGKYRESQVFLRGIEWLPPKPIEVPREMKSLLAWYSKNKKKLHPVIIASYFHVGFETVHPFVDGNGRVGRLLMNFILHKNKYPMVNIPNRTKQKYFKALQSAQIKGDLRPFVELIVSLYKKEVLKF